MTGKENAHLIDNAGQPDAGPSSPTPSSFLYGCVLTASLGSFLFGYTTGAIAGALLYIDEEFPLTAAATGALVASVLLGALVAAVGCAIVSDFIGRRRCLLGSTLFYLVGSLGMASAPTLHALIAFRFVAGIGVGVSSSEVNKYIGELAPAPLRGFFGGIAAMAVTVGILTSYATGLLLADMSNNWRWLLGLGALPALLMLSLQALLPESPYWLLVQSVRRNDLTLSQAAERTMALLQAPSTYVPLRVAREAEAVRAGARGTAQSRRWHSEHASLTGNDPTQAEGASAVSFPRALVVTLGLHVLQQAAGINVVVYYSAVLLKAEGFDDRGAMLLTLAIGLCQLTALTVLIRLVDAVGRRPLALAGIAGMAVAHGLLAAALSPAAAPLLRLPPAWVAVSAMFLFRATFSLSLGPLPFIITAEIFPPERRSLGMGAAWASNWAANAVVCLTFPLLRDALPTSTVFAMYSTVCLVALLFVWAVVPETKSTPALPADARSTDSRTMLPPTVTDAAPSSASWAFSVGDLTDVEAATAIK